MIIELKSKFLSFQTTKHGDIVEIVDSGRFEPQKSKFNDKEELITVFNVKHNGNDATFSLYEKYKMPLIEKWTNDSSLWIGKKFTILHINNKMEISPI